MNDLLFDTCFLIDLEKEMRRGAGAAIEFVNLHADDRFWISWTVVGEFADGFGSIHAAACSAMLDRFEIVEMDGQTADQYARISSTLRKSSQLIGANDLWIAAAALAADFPLVTNNSKHFDRVPGLTVIGY